MKHLLLNIGVIAFSPLVGMTIAYGFYYDITYHVFGLNVESLTGWRKVVNTLVRVAVFPIVTLPVTTVGAIVMAVNNIVEGPVC